MKISLTSDLIHNDGGWSSSDPDASDGSSSVGLDAGDDGQEDPLAGGDAGVGVVGVGAGDGPYGFDEGFMKQMQTESDRIHQVACEQAAEGPTQCFSFVELCEAQAKINQEAAVSPSSSVPLQVVGGGSV